MHARATRRTAGVLAMAAAALLAAACGAEPPPEGARLSLLAVGDAGAEPDRADHYATLLGVARSMAESDEAGAVDALVLLGDNFYPDGLREVELARRVGADLARPFCRFLAGGAPRFAELAADCARPGATRHPVTILAVLGNHDTVAPESPALQRHAVEQFLASWRMPPGPAAAIELGHGVSLVAFDSTAAFAGGAAAAADLAALEDALREARGPWRVLASHHPVAGAGTGDEQERYVRYRRGVLEAIEAAGVPVQLALAGHEHNLQLLAMDPPGPALQVVAGAGSAPRGIHDDNPRRRFGLDHTPGFARVDLVGEGEDEELVVSLYARPGWPRRVLGATQLVARVAVDRAGDLEDR
jgi:Calcineurin-like phosphoesterase